MSLFRTVIDEHIDTTVDEHENRRCAGCSTPLTGPDGQPVAAVEGSPELNGAIAAHIVHVAAVNGWQPSRDALAGELVLLLWNFAGCDLEDAVALTAGVVPLLEEHLDKVPFDIGSFR